ncbi:hypothetical protein RB195_023442 [Necator americanus]|uniref:Uncharacterized protein n=1 Tax=Necator americanus TaxID=51031 RepID=A0ABR1ELP3_NECAM
MRNGDPWTSHVRRANEEDDLWRRHANQGGDRQYHGMARTIADAKDNVDDRASTIVPPTATRPARKRRPPSQLQADPKMKTHAMRSS